MARKRKRSKTTPVSDNDEDEVNVDDIDDDMPALEPGKNDENEAIESAIHALDDRQKRQLLRQAEMESTEQISSISDEQQTEQLAHGTNIKSEGSENAVLTILTVHSSVDLHCKLDIRGLVEYARNAIFEPRKATAGARITLREPAATCTVFESGKMVVLGGRSEAESKLAARKLARAVQKAMLKHEAAQLKINPSYLRPQDSVMYRLKFSGFRTNNITASGHLPYSVNLIQLSKDPEHDDNVEYEPERFPCLYYRLESPQLTAGIFGNGKLSITGARSENDLIRGFNIVEQILRKFALSSLPRQIISTVKGFVPDLQGYHVGTHVTADQDIDWEE